MIVSSPIWYTRANVIRCRNKHRPRNAGTTHRGDTVILHACQRAGCDECALGIQNLTLDCIVWHAISRAQYDAINKTDPCTPVLTLLYLADYHSAEADAPEAAA